MKAAILTAVNAPLVVADVTLPEKLEYGQVLVRVLVSGICGAQLQEIAGLKGNADHMPHLLGHEGCGIVEEIGPAVTRVKPGDKVVMHWRKAEGIEAPFPEYGWKHAKETGAYTVNELVGGGRVTTLCEQAVISENRLTPVPADTPPELCALLGCSLSTALGTIESAAAVKFGESVLIVGVGGLGCNLIRCASMANAFPITATDIHDEKRNLALIMGADFFFNTAKKPVTGTFDVIIETSGQGINSALHNLAPSGRFIMVGQPKPGQAVVMEDACHMFQGDGKHICATQGGGFRPHLDIPRYLRLNKAGILDTGGIITRRLSLDDINVGIDLVRAGQAGRVLIEM